MNSEYKEYILVMRDHGFAVIGPFGSQMEREAWVDGSGWEGHDDPRWQVVEMTEEQGKEAVKIILPGDSAAKELICCEDLRVEGGQLTLVSLEDDEVMGDEEGE